ncbi:hypothetical protein T08_8769 [Trichinella sp. T8]|nr:hypothetical protein T08_8769 [Trichinella sp. T8]
MSCSREAGKGERTGIADAVRDHHRHRGEEATKSVVPFPIRISLRIAMANSLPKYCSDEL